MWSWLTQGEHAPKAVSRALHTFLHPRDTPHHGNDLSWIYGARHRTEWSWSCTGERIIQCVGVECQFFPIATQISVMVSKTLASCDCPQTTPLIWTFAKDRKAIDVTSVIRERGRSRSIKSRIHLSMAVRWWLKRLLLWYQWDWMQTKFKEPFQN